MEQVDKNILEWTDKFNNYLELETKCNIGINNILQIKNTFKTLLGNQKKDDIQFYKSLVDNTHFYLTSSLKIRKIKFLKDLNYIWSLMDERKQMDELTSVSFIALLKDYRNMNELIIHSKKNNTTLMWVKDDKVGNLSEVENEMNQIMEYHSKLIQFFASSVEIEHALYCGK